MDDALRLLVWKRANACCEYCRLPFSLSEAPFQIDHIAALKHRGQTVEENLALSCFDCNSYKGSNIAGFDPVGGRMSRIYHPRRDAWQGHFEWHAATLVGKTPIGRTTIQVLCINNPESVRMRQLWSRLGVFPYADRGAEKPKN